MKLSPYGGDIRGKRARVQRGHEIHPFYTLTMQIESHAMALPAGLSVPPLATLVYNSQIPPTCDTVEIHIVGSAGLDPGGGGGLDVNEMSNVHYGHNTSSHFKISFNFRKMSMQRHQSSRLTSLKMRRGRYRSQQQPHQN